MAFNTGRTLVLAVLALLVIPAGAAAALNTIAQGNMVFLGEQGLDITGAMGSDTRIAWWASAAQIGTSAPSYTIDVGPTATAFFADPNTFSGKLGPWYRLNAAGQPDGPAFVIADPNLDMRIWDATVGVDASSNGWITSGDVVEFRITTNLYQMGERSGVTGAPITIKVQSPDGATYTALTGPSGSTYGLVDLPVGTSPFSTGPVWDTGRPDLYPPGTYRIWAECNANSMKDNYNYPGRTYTPQWGLLDQERNPLITLNTRTTAVTTAVQTTVPATAVTTVPATTTTMATTIATPAPTTVATTAAPVPPAPATTKPSPGFAAALGCSALVLALALAARKE